MDVLLPITILCILPLVWTGVVFALGRWSVRYRIVERQATPYRQPAQNQQQASSYYDNFEEA